MRGVLAAKETECANLQSALGAFNAELDEGHRRANEAAALRIKNSGFIAELVVEREKTAAANVRAAAAATMANGHIAAASAAKEEVLRLAGEVTKLRAALRASAMRATDSQTAAAQNPAVDKRIVAKLLVTYFERGHPVDVLCLMMRMLDMSPHEQRRIIGGGGGGDDAGGGTSGGGSIVAASTSHATGEKAMADAWVDFLLAEDAAGGMSRARGGT